MSSSARREFFGTERLLAVSDGVFAVAITLLVLDVRSPSAGTDGADSALLAELIELWPKLAIFCFSFIIVGINWLGHHRKFNYIKRVDGSLLWLNLIYLMTLCLVPFATSVLSGSGSRLGFIVYVLMMALVTLISAALSLYGLRAPFVDAPDLRPGMRTDMILSPLSCAVIFVVSAGLAYGNQVDIAHWTLLAIFPVLAFLGSRSHRST
jgi:uncharacterized membrane protein